MNNEYTTSFDFPVNTYSFDTYLDSTFDNPFQFEMDVISDNSNIDLDGFVFYGLKKENGHSHWEKIKNK